VKVTTECDRAECFGCVDGECQILTNVKNKGEGCSFYKPKHEQRISPIRYEEESGKWNSLRS